MSQDREPFTIAFVPGVTLSKWTRVWEDRHPDVPLRVLQTDPGEQTAVLRDGRAGMSFVRLPVDDDEGLSVIPLWSEAPFVVVPKDHVVSAVDEVTLADLADENHLGGGYDEAIELVAANVGVVVVPQSIARLFARRDVVARPVTDAAETRIALAWVTERTDDLVDEFVGIVRGRTARSSRGAAPVPAKAKQAPARKAAPAARRRPARRR